MSREDFNDRLKRLQAADEPTPGKPAAPARATMRNAPEASPGAKIGRIAGAVGGFALGTFAAVSNTLYRDAIGTTAEADMLMGLAVFMVATGLVGFVALAGLGSLLFGKRWWGLWAFVGGYLVAFGIAGFVADFGSLGAST